MYSLAGTVAAFGGSAYPQTKPAGGATLLLNLATANSTPELGSVHFSEVL